MGEVVGGIIVVGLFIAFVMWKNRGKTKQGMTAKDWYKEEWWGEQKARETVVSPADGGDRDGNDD